MLRQTASGPSPITHRDDGFGEQHEATLGCAPVEFSDHCRDLRDMVKYAKTSDEIKIVVFKGNGPIAGGADVLSPYRRPKIL